MRLSRLKLENFQSYMESEVLLSESKLFFITGVNRDTNSSNGCGKSSIKEAILFSLTGRTKVRGGDIVRRGAKKTTVELDLFHNNSLVQIIRTKAGLTSTLDVRINQNKLQGSLTEVQAQLEKLLGFNYEILSTYSVIDHVRFLDLSDLSSSDLKLVLQDLIGVEQIQSVIEKMKEYKNSLDRYLEKTSTKFYPSKKRLQVLLQYKNNFDTQMGILNQSLVEISSQQRTLQSEVYSLESTLKSTESDQIKVLSQSACPVCNASLSEATKLQLLNTYQTSVDQLTTTREQKLKIVQEGQPRLQTLTKESNQLQKQLLQCLTRITQLEDTMKNQRSIDEVIQEVQLYTKAVSLLQQYISNTLLVLVTQVEDQMNADLSRLTDFYCKINLQKVNSKGVVVPSCNITVWRDEFEYTYEMLSSGEKTLIALVFKLTLAHLRGITDLLLIDEGLDRLDEVNRERVLSLLESSGYSQIFLISHREDVTHLKTADRIIVKKENNTSSIVTG